MRSRGIRAALLPAVLAVGAVAAAACHPAPPPPPPPPASTACSSQAAPTPTPQQPVKYVVVVERPLSAPTTATFTATSETDKIAKVQQLQQQGPVVSVEPDKKVSALDTVPNPGANPSYAQEWGLAAQPGASFPNAWTNGFGGAGTRIAIVDTGVRLTHQNFAGLVVAGPDFVANSNGSVAVTGDPHGHGTHTAGIAGAKNNDTGTLGGAPNATIVAVRVLDQNGNGFSSDVASGITWAAKPQAQGGGGVNVISLSLGGACPSSDMQTAVEYAKSQGVVVAAAAGNDSSCSAVEYPGGYSTDGNAAVIAVAATDNGGNRAAYSNCGSYVSIAAPGGGGGSSPASGVLSTYNASNASYAVLSGTSMATPLVGAAAALMEEKCSGITPGQVRADLEAHSGPAVPGFVFNRLDAGAATAAAC
jgi:subtilisin family serine protease